MQSDVGGLQAQVAEIASELAAKPIVKPTAIVDLGTTSLILNQPIQIVVEVYPDEVTASWPEVEAFGSGDSEGEAILELKRDIVSLYTDLAESPDDELGPLALTWKRALVRVISAKAVSLLQTQV